MQKQHLTISRFDKALIIVLGMFLAVWTLSVKKLAIPSYSANTLNEFGSVFIYVSDILAYIFVALFIIKYNKIIILSINDIVTHFNRCVFSLFHIVPRGTISENSKEIENVPRGTFLHRIQKNVPRGTFAGIITKIVPRGTISALLIPAALIFLAAITQSFELNHRLHIYKSLLICVFIIFIYLFFTKALQKIVPRGTILVYFLIALILSGVVNAIVAILQFFSQSSLGLDFLRESGIDVTASGVAKIHIFGTVLVRPYGLLPHPNVLSGVLILTMAATIAFYSLKNRKIVPRGTMCGAEENVPRGTFLVIIALFVQAIAFILAFSRSAAVSIVISGIIYFTLQRVKALFHVEQLGAKEKKLFHVEQYERMFALGVLFIVAIISTIAVYGSYKVRCDKYVTQSLCERSLYTQAALRAIAKNPVYGSGNDIAMTVDNYVNKDILSWQYQPVHNIFLLIIAENGVIVFAAIVCIIYRILKIVPRGTISENSKEIENVPRGTILHRIQKNVPRGTFAGIITKIVPRGTIDTQIFGFVFISYLIIGCFDHYLLDIQQGFVAFLLSAMLTIYTKDVELDKK